MGSVFITYGYVPILFCHLQSISDCGQPFRMRKGGCAACMLADTSDAPRKFKYSSCKRNSSAVQARIPLQCRCLRHRNLRHSPKLHIQQNIRTNEADFGTASTKNHKIVHTTPLILCTVVENIGRFYAQFHSFVVAEAWRDPDDGCGRSMQQVRGSSRSHLAPSAYSFDKDYSLYLDES